MLARLAKTQIFANLDSHSLHVIEQNAHSKQVDPGHCFVRQGEPALFFYVLKRGHAKVTQVTPDGHQVLVRYIGPGQEFGLVAVLSGYEYPTTVQAVDECEVLVWAGELLAQLMERYPLMGFNALRIFAEQNQELQRRYQELLTERVEQRLAQSILRLAQQAGHRTAEGTVIDLPLSREDLAEIVGTDIFVVSRIMSRWEQDELVQTDRKSVLLLQQAALERLASPI
jgi:CRP/FNR family transcriptional regulator, nitrogen oxide reductase regulator